MEFILAAILSFVALGLFMLLMEGLPKSIQRYLLLKRYNFIEPEYLLKLKEAIFASSSPLSTECSFKLNGWFYYHYIKELTNYSESYQSILTDYDIALIQHWIKTHNKQLRTNSLPVGHRH